MHANIFWTWEYFTNGEKQCLGHLYKCCIDINKYLCWISLSVYIVILHQRCINYESLSTKWHALYFRLVCLWLRSGIPLLLKKCDMNQFDFETSRNLHYHGSNISHLLRRCLNQYDHHSYYLLYKCHMWTLRTVVQASTC